MEPTIVTQILHVILNGDEGGHGAPNLITIIHILIHHLNDPGGVVD